MSTSDLIINTSEKRVEVKASPGSGKTYCLLHRILHLLSLNVNPTKILVLSFSTATVGEIHKRLKHLSTESDNNSSTSRSKRNSITDMSDVIVQTAHGFALSLIRGRPNTVDVLEDQEVFIGQVILSLHRQAQRLSRGDKSPSARHRLIELHYLSKPSLIKLVTKLLTVVRARKTKLSTAITKGEFVQLARYHDVICEIRDKYSAIKKQRGVVDFADMLDQARKIIIGNPKSVPFTHILVDEYQDCSASQVQLLADLANLPGRSIIVLGDPDQGIHDFAGSCYRPLSSVLTDVTTLSLPESRRLTAQTAALASAVAQHRPDQSIQTTKTGPTPVLVTDQSLASQTQHIVTDILALIAKGVSASKIVVLARIKAVLQPVEQSLLAHQILTKRLGMTRDRKHVKAVLSIVRLVERCIDRDETITVKQLRSALPQLTGHSEDRWKRESLRLRKALCLSSLEGRYRLCAATYLRLMGGIRSNAELRADVNRWEPYCRGHRDARSMLRAVSRINASAVVTSTIHAAKGGEWTHVLIVGTTDGLLPNYLSTTERQIKEDRRLLFVAITRAEKAVRLYHSPTDHARSRQRFDRLCRFLDKPAVRDTLRFE